MPYVVKKTITETYLERVISTPDVVGFQYKLTHAAQGSIGTWRQVTFKEFNNECRLISFGLMGLGVGHDDKVAILSNTRFEWALSDMAILGAGGVTVPIYSSNVPSDIAYILNDSDAKVIIVENAQQLEKVLQNRAELPKLEKIVVIDAAAMALAVGRKDILSFQALQELGHREEGRDPTRFEKNLTAANPSDLITICYTSGTTGMPKGVMITHDNMVSVADDVITGLGEYVKPDSEVLLTFLPCSHIFGKVEMMLTYGFGWRESYAESIDKLMANLSEIRPTVIFSVPRIFEKAYGRIRALLEEGSPAKRALFERAFSAGQEFHAAIASKRAPSLGHKLMYQAGKSLIFNKIVQRFGSRLKYAISGGAPLSREIADFFQVVGIDILEGYGLTETCGPITVNTPDHFKAGTVGRPLGEVSLKIAEDGEVLVKSRKIFKGYYKQPDETARVVVNGWFHTGDIGSIDSEGFLKITDRKKDLIVTSGGKNIAPQKIENLAKSFRFISQFVVQGDRRNYLTALITLDRDAVIEYANEHQIFFSEYLELVKHHKIQHLVQKTVDEINSKLASYETIKKFIILPQDFTVESGEMTPSLKVKRNIISKNYKSELDSMYNS